MYTTRRLSFYKKSPEALSEPPEGPNSGYLVIQDDDEFSALCCFGLCEELSIKDLPFPQNKLLAIENKNTFSYGHQGSTAINMVYLIPVINQPLSSQRYYAIKADGKRKGEVYSSSKEEDKVINGFDIPWVREVKPRPPFDPNDIYQQFKFSANQACFNSDLLFAESVPIGGFPPTFLRKPGWQMVAMPIRNFIMGEARGIDSSIRAHLPDFSFPSLSQERSKSVVVGKWYCPFMFIKDGGMEEQIKNSVFYEMTLKQKWERIFAVKRSFSYGKTVSVNVAVSTETIRIKGGLIAQQEGTTQDIRGMVHFKGIDGLGVEKWVGLSSLILERMMWEEEKVGWIKKKEKQVKVIRDEEYGGVGEWRSYDCYVLVETFVLKKSDGSIVLTYDFRHTHQLKSKWNLWEL